MSQLDDVKDLARTMRELGIRRAAMTRDGIEVELFGDAPAGLAAWLPEPGAPHPLDPLGAGNEQRRQAEPPAQAVPDPAKPVELPPLPPEVQALLDDAKPQTCACGHPWAEHNEAGCFAGCDLGSCGKVEVPPPEARKA